MFLTTQLQKLSGKTPDKVAIYCQSQKITFLELYRQSQTLHATLKNILQSAGPAPRVALLFPNSIAGLTAFLATDYSGIIPLIYNSDWPLEQLKQVIAFSQPDLLVVHRDILDAQSHMSTLHDNLLVIQDNMPHDLSIKNRHKTSFYPKLNEEVLFVGFTSGTTTIPKGFIRSEKSWEMSFQASQQAFQLESEHHFIIPGPLAHGLSFYAAIEALTLGATITIQPKFNLQQLRQDLQNHSNSVLVCVPTILRKIQHESDPKLIFSKVSRVITSAEKLDEKTEFSLKETFPNAQIYEYYGASELGFMSLRQIHDRIPSSSVGNIFPTVQVKILDEHKQECANNKLGQIWIKNNFIMSGYLAAQEESNFEQEQGWATVGDLGYLDDQGYLYVVGRKNDMIITAGYNVYPHEVEQAFKSLDFVKDAFAFDLPDKVKGTIIGAAIVFNQPTDITKADLKKMCQEKLTHYKFPKHIYALTNPPLTVTGKVSRRILKEKILMKDPDIHFQEIH